MIREFTMNQSNENALYFCRQAAMTAAVAINPGHLYAQSADSYYLKSQRYAEQVAKTKLPPRVDNVDIPCAPTYISCPPVKQEAM